MIGTTARDGVGQVLRESVEGRGSELRALFGWSAVQAVPALLSGRLIAEAIDRGFLVHRPAEGIEWLAGFGVTLLLGAWGTRQAYRRLAPIVEPFRDSLVTRAVTGALREATRPGATPDVGVVARLTRHVEIAREAFASAFMVVQGFVVTTVSALIGLLTLKPAVLLFVVPPLLAGLGLFLAVLRRTAYRRRDALLAEERIADTTSEMVGATRDVVACGAEDAVTAEASKSFELQRQAAVDVARFSALQTLAIAVGGWLPIVLILTFGSWLRGSGASPGVIVGALAYVLQGVQPALATLVRGIGSNGLWLFVTLDRIVEATSGRGGAPQIEALPAGVPVPSTTGTYLASRSMISVRDVTFGYGAEPVVADLDLDIPHGDHLAVVGPSGVGKSTLTLLMSGLLQPTTGEVLIEGTAVADLDPRGLARRRVLIPQEAYLFSGALWDNLTYLRAEATEDEVNRAVGVLGLRTVVSKVGGYEGDPCAAALSAGERQLIALARSYLSAAPIAILDEATCHLDPVAEETAERAFASREGTLIVVAHRISSARRARRILVMDGTRTVLGDHESLIVDSPLYRDLVGHWTDGLPVHTQNGSRGLAHVNGYPAAPRTPSGTRKGSWTWPGRRWRRSVPGRVVYRLRSVARSWSQARSRG